MCQKPPLTLFNIELFRRIFRSLRRSHTLMSQPAVDVKPVPRDELVPQYIEKLKDSELGFRREYEVGCVSMIAHVAYILRD